MWGAAWMTTKTAAGRSSGRPPTMVVTSTFNPAADSYVNAGSPTSNFGALTALRIDGSPILRAGSGATCICSRTWW